MSMQEMSHPHVESNGTSTSGEAAATGATGGSNAGLEQGVEALERELKQV